MSDRTSGEQGRDIDLEFEFDEPLQKVWRAISMPEFRENWLPGDALADPEPTSVTPGEEVRYRMREATPPFLESTVTFRIRPNADGGTSLRVIHELTDARAAQLVEAAVNTNSPALMLAA